MKSISTRAWGIIGLVVLISLVMGADVIRDYAMVIFIAVIVGMILMSIGVMATANLRDTMKRSENARSLAQEAELQKREVLRDGFLPTVCDALAHIARENKERGDRIAGGGTSGAYEIIVKRIGDSVIVFIEDGLSPEIVLSGVRGWPVLHLSVRPEEEKANVIEVFFGSYVNDPIYFSIDQRWEALKLAAEYLEKFDMPEIG